jgi:hypothetical protein
MEEKKFVVKDSGKRQEFETGSKRDTRDGKGRYDLVSTIALRRLALVYENGAKKYGDRNWEKGQPLMRYVDSAKRHLECLVAGEPTEDHAAQVAWNMFSYIHTLALIDAGRLPCELDDRPTAEPQYAGDAVAAEMAKALQSVINTPPTLRFEFKSAKTKRRSRST